MPTTVILNDVIHHSKTDPADLRVEVLWGDGSSTLHESLEALQEQALKHDKNEDLTKDLCLAYALARSPDLSNINPIQGRDFTFDLSHNNPIRVT